MKKSSRMLAGALMLSVGPLCWAGEENHRPDHFKGIAAATLQQAAANFSEYNGKLATILEQDALSPQDLHEVHQLTYTLENALEKMRTEFSVLAGVLEEVHVASESADPATVRARGEAYLDTARQVVP